MRTVLYFRLRNATVARSVHARLMALPASPVRVKGPWFIHSDGHAIEGLKNADSHQTTYRGEFGALGTLCGAVSATLSLVYLGNTGEIILTIPACVVIGAMGALIGWWLGRWVGGLVHRGRIARSRAKLVLAETLMVVSCTSGTKDSVKLMITELGGETIGEHNRVLPDFDRA